MKKIHSLGLAICILSIAVATDAWSQTAANSLNAVGAARITLPPGLSLFATQFLKIGGGDQSLDDIFGTQLPGSSKVYLFLPGKGYNTFRFTGSQWVDAQQQAAGTNRVERGDGVWVFNAASTSVTVVVTGEVPGESSDVVELDLPAGLRLISFAFPSEVDAMNSGLVPAAGDKIHSFKPGEGYKTYTFSAGKWRDSGNQEVNVMFNFGVAYWYESASARPWTQIKPYAYP
jgi:hypothetical protein